MTKGNDKTERLHDDEIDLTRPLVPLVDVENERDRREKFVARLRLLWSRRAFLGRVAAVGLMASVLVAFLISNRYTSTAKLMPPDEQSSNGMALLAGLAGKSGSALGTLGSQLLGLKTTSDLFIGILQSRTIQDDLIQKFDLRKLYGDKLWTDARTQLQSRTSISTDRTSGIITISVQDKSPARAQQMAEEYVSELNQVVNSLNTSSAHRERVFLEGRLSQVQQDLESAEEAFSRFASKNTAIDIQEQGKAMIEAGATLQGQLVAAQTELEGLRQIFTDNNVRIRETQARVDELRRQIQRVAGNGSSSPSSGATESETLYPSIRKLPLLGVSYADLYRRMKVEEAVFESLTQEYELAKVEEAKETPTVKVLDPPNIPERKSYPHRLLITLFGTFVVGISGIGWVLAGEQWQAADTSDSRKALAVEVWTDVRRALARKHANGTRPNVVRPQKGSLDGDSQGLDESSARND